MGAKSTMAPSFRFGSRAPPSSGVSNATVPSAAVTRDNATVFSRQPTRAQSAQTAVHMRRSDRTAIMGVGVGIGQACHKGPDTAQFSTRFELLYRVSERGARAQTTRSWPP